MIYGRVDPRRQSFVSLQVIGLAGHLETINALVDTGFTGALLLPLGVVQRLGLEPSESVTMRLADGSRVEVPRYLARVIWEGSEKLVSVPASGRQPLLVTGLLDGHRLLIDIVPGGLVSIEALAAP